MPAQSSIDSMPLRMAKDINDIKFDYSTLIFDENATIENQ
jgi:hypothetical protein